VLPEPSRAVQYSPIQPVPSPTTSKVPVGSVVSRRTEVIVRIVAPGDGLAVTDNEIVELPLMFVQAESASAAARIGNVAAMILERLRTTIPPNRDYAAKSRRFDRLDKPAIYLKTSLHTHS
jgi:hypothetical protein